MEKLTVQELRDVVTRYKLQVKGNFILLLLPPTTYMRALEISLKMTVFYSLYCYQYWPLY